MSVTVAAPGVGELAGDIRAAADALDNLDAPAHDAADHIARRAATAAPRRTSALATGIHAEAATVVVAGVAADYADYVRFGTRHMAGVDYIAAGLDPDDITRPFEAHLETTITRLDKTYD